MQIQCGEKLFEFPTFNDWCNTAQYKFARAGVNGTRVVAVDQKGRNCAVVAVDQKGRICAWGEHFMKARDDNTFPVEVFRLRADMTPSKRNAQPQQASGENNPGNAGR